MIKTIRTIRAYVIAFQAHYGQVDKAGKPYINHPLAVADKMTTEASTCAALLHDVLEDALHDKYISKIEKSMPHDVVEAVKLLTRDKDVGYMDYIKKLADNPIAREVKIADLEHNMDLSRLDGKPDKLKSVKIDRYKKAHKYLVSRRETH